MKKSVRHVSFTSGQKKNLIKDCGYEWYNYSGKQNDAPREWRHLYRSYKPGYYLVQSGTGRPLRFLSGIKLDGRFEEVQRNVVDAAFLDTLAREVGYRLQGIYVAIGKVVSTSDYRSKEDVTYHDGYLDEVATYMHNEKARTGYYFYGDDGRIIGPYKDFSTLLFDAIMEEDMEDLYEHGTVTNKTAPPVTNISTVIPPKRLAANAAYVGGGITIQRSGAFEFVLQNGLVVGMFFQPGIAQLLAS